MATVFGLKLDIIGLAIISVVILIIFGVPLATIGFFLAKNVQLVLIFGALLFVLSLLTRNKK